MKAGFVSCLPCGQPLIRPSATFIRPPATPHPAFGHLLPREKAMTLTRSAGTKGACKNAGGHSGPPLRDPATWHHLIHHFVIFHLPYGLTLTLVYQGAGSPAFGHPSSGLRPPSPEGEGYDTYPPCGHQAHAKTRAGTAACPYRDPATWYHLIHHFVVYGHYTPWGNIQQACSFGDDQRSEGCIGGKWYNCDSAIIHS